MYEVTGQDSQSDPVFTIRNIETGEKKTLHRNCLFPISHRVNGEDDQSNPKGNVVLPFPMVDKSEIKVSEDKPLHRSKPLGKPEYTGPTTCSRARSGADVQLNKSQRLKLSHSDEIPTRALKEPSGRFKSLLCDFVTKQWDFLMEVFK